MFPLLKETGSQSFCEGHGTRYWEFKINGHFYGLRKNPNGTITHYDNDIKGAKKYHVWIEFNGCITPKVLDTNDFREAFNFLVKYVVKPVFTGGVS